MVFRLVKKICAALSLLMIFTVLWFLYLLFNHPQASSSPDHVIHYPSLPSNKLNHSSPSSASNHSNSNLNQSISTSHRREFQTSLISRLLNNASDFNNLDTKRGKDLLSRVHTNCRDRICSEFVTVKDKVHFKYCVRKTWGVSLSAYTEPVNSECVFIDGTDHYPVGLASYPGSGNTWVRGLIQQVTGLCIGAIYCDVTLRQNGFPGESVRSGITFMVKTHQVDPRWEGVYYPPDAPFAYFETLDYVPVYSGGVFVMRNPFHAMVAEYKRETWVSLSEPDNHVRTLSQDSFGNNTKWSEFVHREAKVWQETVLGWLLRNQNRPIMVTKYEDLLVDVERELNRILVFLQVPYSREQLRKVVKEGYSQYHRQGGAQFEHYTQSQKDYVRGVIRSTADAIGDSGLVDISDYAS